MFAPLLLALALHVLPRPVRFERDACSIAPPMTAPASIDPGALDIWRQRWSALKIGNVGTGTTSQVRFVHDGAIPPQGYDLVVASDGVTITSDDVEGAFYGIMTLAQLPVREGGHWILPCVHVSDQPALHWRVLSDDVSRGPLPTMAYFQKRIRTIAAFKMNGYAPYMENVFVSPTDPLPAPPDGITPQQLHDLSIYAARYHVALIPEQQTFAHMHNTLRLEEYASAAELPHGNLIAPNNDVGMGYLQRIIGQELAAVPHPPFFHIGSDETSTLGEGTTAAYVAANGGRGPLYAQHVREMNDLLAPSGARVMIWDDGIEADPSIMKELPWNAVIVNWHYGLRKTYMPFIRRIASGDFQQMVAPGANNWSELFPDLATALPSEQRFIDEGKAARVLGLFQTVWHDDGESLFEATWYPVLYAASDAWNTTNGFSEDFPWAFFGVDDPAYSRDEQDLGSLATRLPELGDRMFWADPFLPAVAAKMGKVDLARMRLAAERVMTDMIAAHPPLHAHAAEVMLLAARRYDALGRRYQIAREVRDYYTDAGTHPNDAIRDLFWCKYWLWEQRDSDERIAIEYANAWRWENREDHLASNLEKYHRDAQIAIGRADAIDRVIYDSYVPHKTLPPLDTVLGISP